MSLVTAVVGAQWGDEGKGKLVDALAEGADFVARFQGGSNAGHTINNDFGRFALHLLPSGVFAPGVTNVLGTGVAVNIEKLFEELDALLERGVPEPIIKISDRAHILFPFHILLDQYEEERLADKAYGSTKSGIAPFYADKCRKKGIQLAALRDWPSFKEKVESSLVTTNVLIEHLYGKEPIKADDVMASLEPLRARIEPLLCDTSLMLRDAISSGKKVLLEGQLGTLRDLEHGIYPYSTSSSTLAGFAAVGAGVPPHEISRIIAVVKAYSSMVGTGTLVSAIQDQKEAEELRKRGGDKGEYGATTGRPRDVGWFDSVAAGYGVGVQGATEVCLTNLDVLGYLDEIPICSQYEIDGERTKVFPPTGDLPKAKPVYETAPGWDMPKEELSQIRSFELLPKNAQAYVERVEELLQVPVKTVSVGPARADIIHR